MRCFQYARPSGAVCGKKVKGNAIKKRVYHKVEDAACNSEINKTQGAKSHVKRDSKPEAPGKEIEEEPLK